MSQEKAVGKTSDLIDSNLKRVYDDMLEEKVPDKFLDLLAQLKDQDKGNGPSGDAQK